MVETASMDPEAVDRFNQGLDQLLRTGELPAQAGQNAAHMEMLSIAQALASANLAAMSSGRASLRQRLLSQPPASVRRRTTRILKPAGVLAALLLVAMTVFVLSPPLRSWAQDVLARVGSLIITNAPTYAEQALPEITTATPGPSQGAHLESVSQEEASRRAGFQVLAPRDLPKQWRQQFIFYRDNRAIVVGIYDHWYGVAIAQIRLPEDQSEEFPIGDAEVIEVEVRGKTGYWIEEAATSIIGGGGSAFHLTQDDIVWQLGHNDILAWQERSIVYVIIADDELSLDDLLAIAESLAL